jgi:hypothetical protein
VSLLYPRTYAWYRPRTSGISGFHFLQSDVRLEWNDDAEDEDADDPAVRGSSTSMFMGMRSKSASFPLRLSCGGTCRVCIGWFFTARQEKSSNYPTCGIRAHACKKILCKWSNVGKMQGHGSLAGEKMKVRIFRNQEHWSVFQGTGSSNMHFLAFSISGPPRSGVAPEPPL